jgi:poly-gamma-glutamate synthesis protein (capsule biosynthesis protein)
MMGIATLRIVGDIMLGGSVIEKIKENGTSFPFEKLTREMEPSDIFFGNLECPLFGSNQPPITNKILLQSNPLVIEGIKESGINIVSLANNHSFDYGFEAFRETRSALEKNGIKCVGGGKNIIEASKFTLFEVNGLRFGFLGYCSEEAACKHFASDSLYGVAPVEPERIKKDIKKAKSETDFVIVSLHWGYEFRDYPSPENIRIARDLIENGATLVTGTHTHVFQGYEKYRNGLILYDLGSFIFGDILINKPFKYKFFLKKRKHKEGIIVDCVFNKKRLIDYKFTPLLINLDFQATAPDSRERQKIVNRFEKQSKKISAENYGLFYSGYLLKIKMIKFLVSIKASLKRCYASLLTK